MTEGKDIFGGSSAGPTGAGDAVGVPSAKWFIAIVNNNTEKATAERLDSLGIENYLPTQTVILQWKNGRKGKVVRVVIPTVIFIRCSERQRREIVTLPFINRFMTNKAGTSNVGKPVATVPEVEIERLKFMLGQSDIPVEISRHIYNKGERVRIIRGSLAGLEGEVHDLKSDNSELTITLEHFGCAKLIIDTANLEPIS